MRKAVSILGGALIVSLLMAVGGLVYVKATGLRGQPRPGDVETRIARAVRGLAVPREIKARRNPLPATPDTIKPGLEHFARYCSLCHGNDGNWEDSALGGGLFPKPPDMRTGVTQGLTDGELFYIIENGVRFTGMPAFGTGEESQAGAQQVWQLVHFIRHLPRITADEIAQMKSLNPL